MLDETKELLTRFAADKLQEIPDTILTKDMKVILNKVYDLRKDLKKKNVSAALHRLFPEATFPSPQLELCEDELVTVVSNQQAKQKLIAVESKLQDALLFNSGKSSHNWDKTLNDIASDLTDNNVNVKDYVTFADLSFEEADRVVLSTGFPLLDHYLGGGYESSSYSVWYGASNLGKTSVVTAYLSATAIKAGKFPLIISLEGSPQRLMKRILSILTGSWGQDISSLSDFQKKNMLETAENIKGIPIIKSNAKSIYAMKRYIAKFNPDLIIYDQLTISGGGREWTEIAKVSEMLKKISLDYDLPVVALTQSDGKNYGGKNQQKDEDGNDAVEYIKYAQAIFEDATNVVQIGKYAHNPETGRVLTLRKCKNDETAKILPIEMVIEMTSNGFKELGVKDGYKPLISPDKVMKGKVVKEVKKVETKDFCPEVEEVIQYKETPEEIQQTDVFPSEFPTSLFSQDTVETMPDRLMVWKGFQSDNDLKVLKHYLSAHQIVYGESSDPSYGVRFYDARELGETYARYYYE